MLKYRIAAWCAIACGLVGFASETRGQQTLTPEEASRPWEQWTAEQLAEKNWIPYPCALEEGVGRAP
ncbi:MAG: hypothetical protein ACYTFA_09590, partial [Planctomycetota bacterium]